MFYSQNEFYNAVVNNPDCFSSAVTNACKVNGVPNRKRAAAVLAEIKKAVANYRPQVDLSQFFRPSSDGASVASLHKFARPWHVVPELARFRAPEGDFSVGVEIEFGFINPDAASQTIKFAANWKHVTFDREGGIYGVETTFPPMLYSKIRNDCVVFKYVQHLAQHPDRLVRHRHGSSVGTHINVGSHINLTRDIVGAMAEHLSNIVCRSNDNAIKYFGRRPYGYLYNHGGFVEYKLFNSTTDVVAVRRYINIAVSLQKLMTARNNRPSYSAFTEEEVLAALERGYNGEV